MKKIIFHRNIIFLKKPKTPKKPKKPNKPGLMVLTKKPPTLIYILCILYILYLYIYIYNIDFGKEIYKTP